MNEDNRYGKEVKKVKKQVDVATEIKVEQYGGGTSEDFARWSDKFEKLVAEDVISVISSQESLKKLWGKIKIKNWLNKLFATLRLNIELSTRKHYEEITKIMKEDFSKAFLHLNGWDEESIEGIEEMRKDRSIEGIRKQLPHIDSEKLEAELV